MNSSSNLAYLILAHHQPELLKELISRLQNKKSFFFVHIDKKSDIGKFDELSTLGNVTLIKNRVNVRWGGFSQVQSVLNLIAEANRSGVDFCRYTLLSGCDMPAYSGEEITDALLKDNHCYIHVDSAIDEGSHHFGRVSRYHYLDFPLRHSKIRLVKSIAKKILKVLDFVKGTRRFYGGFTPYHGSQWWSLPRSAIEYIVEYIDKNPRFLDFYKNVGIPDENFFQTMIMNSPFQEEVVSAITKNNQYVRGIHYIDWYTEGVKLPKVLNEKDYYRIVASGALFLRKTDADFSSALINSLPA